MRKLPGLWDRALPLRAVEFEQQLDLQITLDPFEYFSLDFEKWNLGLIPAYFDNEALSDRFTKE